jgi:hypothetical protein
MNNNSRGNDSDLFEWKILEHDNSKGNKKQSIKRQINQQERL